MNKTYWIEKKFIGGPLRGLSWEGATTTKFDVGFVCLKPIGNTSPYRIESCVEVARIPDGDGMPVKVGSLL